MRTEIQEIVEEVTRSAERLKEIAFSLPNVDDMEGFPTPSSATGNGAPSVR